MNVTTIFFFPNQKHQHGYEIRKDGNDLFNMNWQLNFIACVTNY